MRVAHATAQILAQRRLENDLKFRAIVGLLAAARMVLCRRA
jgi:hypothetical protein